MKKLTKNKFIVFMVLVFSLGFIIQASKIFAQDNQPESKKAIELSLDGVSTLALENSLDIQIAKFDAYISKTSLKEVESIFDTFLTAEANYRRDKTMRTTEILGSEEKEYGFSLGLEKKLPTGTTLSVEGSTTKNRTDSPFATLNPYNEAYGKVSLKQELGKNFFGISDRAKVKITKIDIVNADFTSLDDIATSLYQVQKAYWNLVLKEKELIIAKDMLGKAKNLYQVYKEKSSLGLVEKNEILAIEALVHSRESQVMVSELEKESAKNQLLFLLNVGEFDQEILTQDSLDCLVSEVNLYQALSAAVENRRDYKKMENQLKKNKIDIIRKRNAMWPQIDLEASFARNSLHPDRGQAWQAAARDSNNEVTFTLNIKVPLENNEAKAKLERVNLEKKQLIYKLKRVERLILQELNDAVNQVNTRQNQVKLFQDTIKIHREKLNYQLKRLGYGRSDADTLIQYEQDLLEARLSLAKYLYEYRVGLIELELAKNTFLDRYWKEEL